MCPSAELTWVFNSCFETANFRTFQKSRVKSSPIYLFVLWQGRILSNILSIISFVFGAMEFQEKLLLRFTDLYYLEIVSNFDRKMLTSKKQEKVKDYPWVETEVNSALINVTNVLFLLKMSNKKFSRSEILLHSNLLLGFQPLLRWWMQIRWICSALWSLSSVLFY